MLILDVDGVLTDGRIVYDGSGEEFKSFHVRDGHGIVLAVRAGIVPAIITGRSSRAVARRAEELGIREVHQGVRDKVACYEDLRARHQLDDREIAFMGDDVVDLKLLRRVGFSAAPRDADPSVSSIVGFKSSFDGGKGAVRELIEFILRARGDWDRLLE